MTTSTRSRSRTLAAALSLAALSLTMTAPASAATPKGCQPFEKQAAKHQRKAKKFDDKALALRKEAQRSAEAQRRFDRFRKLTKQHARQQEKAARKFQKCKAKRLRGSYKGTIEGTELPVSFNVTRNLSGVNNFRAEIEVSCTTRGGSEAVLRTVEFALGEKLKLNDDGRFSARTDTRADPSYSLTGSLNDGTASGTLRYSTGSPFDMEGEYCRSELVRWSAKK